MFDRLLLDTNMVLNAAFVDGSWARRLIALAQTHRLSLFVGHQSLADARARAMRLVFEGGSRRDAGAHIDSMLRALGILAVPGSAAAPIEIPAHDRHVAAEAAAARATLVTTDRELWLACKRAGVAAALPLELLRHFYGIGLANTVFGVHPNRAAGSVFCSGHGGPWATAGAGRYTLLHLVGAVWLYYDASEAAWIAEIEGSTPLVLPARVVHGQLETVALSWRSGDQIQLRAASAEHPTHRPLLRPLQGHFAGNARIGAHDSGQHYWNSTIYVSVMNDRPIGRDLWRELRQHQDVTPNPFDDDRLAAAVRAWCIAGDT